MEKYISEQSYRNLYSICKKVAKDTMIILIKNISSDESGMYYKEALENKLIERNDFFILKTLISKESENNVISCLQSIYEKIVKFGQNKWKI